MADPRFDICLPLILREEGGNDDDPQDHGGRTSRGVIQREYDKWRAKNGLPARDVWTATDAEIRTIYYENYWLPRCPKLHPGVDLSYFNICVNGGPGRADHILAAAIGGTDAETVDRFNEILVAWYRGLKQFPRYGRGWLARAARIHALAAKMVRDAPPVAPPAPPIPKVTTMPTATTAAGFRLPFDQINTFLDAADKFATMAGNIGPMASMFVPEKFRPIFTEVDELHSGLLMLRLMSSLEKARENLDGDAEKNAMADAAEAWAKSIRPPFVDGNIPGARS